MNNEEFIGRCKWCILEKKCIRRMYASIFKIKFNKK